MPNDAQSANGADAAWLGRMDALVQLCHGVDVAAAAIFVAWRERRAARAEYAWTYGLREIETDGASVFGDDCCVMTRQPGPVQDPDPRPVLLSGRRLSPASTALHARQGMARCIAEQRIAAVTVWPPSGSAWPGDPATLHDAYRMHCELERFTQDAAHREQVFRQLLDHACGASSARLRFSFAGHLVRVDGDGVSVDREWLLAWTPRRDAALVNARRFRHRATRLVRESLVAELARRGVRAHQVRPATPPRRTDRDDLVAAWRAGRPQLVRSPVAAARDGP